MITAAINSFQLNLISKNLHIAFLSCVMLLPFSLSAQFSGGSGTSGDPYQVATAQQLDAVRENLTAHYIQIADIDLGGDDPEGAFYNAGEGWRPISGFNGFSGVYDGGGHVITGLFIDRNVEYSGLFGLLAEGATVHHLGIEEVSVSGGQDAGGLAGVNRGYVYQCYVTGSVTGNLNEGYDDTGLFVGKNIRGEIKDCYASGTATSDRIVGGLTGNNNSGKIINCYAAVTIAPGNYAGGLMNYNSGGVSSAYWNNELAERSGGGLGFSTDEMTYPFVADIYQYWDFESVWGTNETDNEGYPFLQWQGYDNEGRGSVSVAFENGNGTKEAPFEIATSEELDQIRNFSASHFIQTADIDLGGADPEADFYNDGQGWLPIQNFSGSYNGKHQMISNLYINRGGIYIGLFGRTGASSARLDSLILRDVMVTGNDYVGGLVGRADQIESISACQVTGEVNSTGSRTGGLIGQSRTSILNCSFEGQVSGEGYYIGGLIGDQSEGTVSQSSAKGTVQGMSNNVGGLIGSTNNRATVTQCFFEGDVSGQDDVGGLIGSSRGNVLSCYVASAVVTGNLSVGGLIGIQDDSYGATMQVQNNYALADVSGADNTGGLIGEVSADVFVIYAFAVGEVNAEGVQGGLVGTAEDNTLNGYWDITVSGIEESNDGEGRTTTEMTYPFVSDVYAFWDFEEIWGANADANNGYPFLRWQSEFTTQGKGNIETPFEGAGTKQNPYLISTPEELNKIRRAPFSHYLQIADIDLGGNDADGLFYNDNAGWEPLQYFAGSYDGGTHTISGLYINRPETNNIGLFNEIWVESEVVTVKGINLEVVGISGGTATGALAGRIRNVNVLNCHISGGEVSGRNNVGGLTGLLAGINTINNSSAENDVTGFEAIGGLVGYIELDPVEMEEFGTKLIEVTAVQHEHMGFVISSSFATGNVSGDYQVGGLVGRIASYGSITNTYARGDVSGTSDMGGLIGINRGDFAPGHIAAIIHSYSTGRLTNTGENEGTNIGGLIGDQAEAAEMIDCYWDTESSGIALGFGNNSSLVPQGRTTAKMTIPYADDTYQEWDFQGIWDIQESENDGYPLLRMRAAEIVVSESSSEQTESLRYALSLSRIPLDTVYVRVHADCEVLVNGQENEETLMFLNDESALQEQEVVVRIQPDAEITETSECFIYHEVTSNDDVYNNYAIDPVRFNPGQSIEEGEQPPVIIYNAVSPNGDGKNDFLFIENIEYYQDNRVAVFNRWGDLVARIEKYDNVTNHWMPDDSVLDGEYVVVVTLDEPSNNEKTFLVVKR